MALMDVITIIWLSLEENIDRVTHKLIAFSKLELEFT